MEQTIGEAFRLIGQLQREIGELQQWRQGEIDRRHRAVFSQKTIEEVAETVIAQQFRLTHHQLRGKDELRVPGRPPMWRLRETFALDDARRWLICLLRQCTSHPYATMRLNYPWLTHRRFSEANAFIQQVLTQPGHESRSQWRDLLEALRQQALGLGIDADRVEDELRYA